MKREYLLVFILSVLIVTSSTVALPVANAQSEITLHTNKEVYAITEAVELEGTLSGMPNQLVALEIRDPQGSTVLLRTVFTDDNGNFIFKFKIPSSSVLGSYEIIANTDVGGTAVKEVVKVTFGSEPTIDMSKSKSGCLIATASFGSELAPQVQQLRETRDNILFKTQSGTAFMTAFNQFYYSFSPTVANWERENPVFKEIVKTAITPLITTLSILNYVGIDSEDEMLGYGIGVILVNIGMYFVAPALLVIRLKRNFISKKS